MNMFMVFLLTFLILDTYVLLYAFVLTKCGDLPVLTYCQPFNTSRWRLRAECKNCPDGKKYHCCKDYDATKLSCKQGTSDCEEIFVEGCAEEKFCKEGEEPLLSFIKNQQKLDQPDVYCDVCHNSNRYNSYANKSTATFSECPFIKRNICTPESHKIECGKSGETRERFCRCDVRNGYHPYSHPEDHPQDGCSFTNYECKNDTNKCGSHQQLLLNYTCATLCKKGFSRPENSDDCVATQTTTSSQKKASTHVDESTISQGPVSTTVPQSDEKNNTGGIDVLEVIGLIIAGIVITVAIIAILYYFRKKIKGGCNKRCRRADRGDVNNRRQSRNVKETDAEAPQHEQVEMVNLLPRHQPSTSTSLRNEDTMTLRDAKAFFGLNDEEYREFVDTVFKKCHVEMVKKLDPVPVIDFFRGKDVFTDTVLDDIQEERKTSGQTRELLRKLKNRGVTSYTVFKESLVKTRQNSCLEELEKLENVVNESILKKRQKSSNYDIENGFTDSSLPLPECGVLSIEI